MSESSIKGRSRASADVLLPSGDTDSFLENEWTLSDKVTRGRYEFGAEGTYFIGLATRPHTIRLAAEKFNRYLKSEGLSDQIAERKIAGESDTAVVERFSKFAKSAIQAGDKLSENFANPLGYPVEIIPDVNTFALTEGEQFAATIYKDGKPLADTLVFASHEAHIDENTESEYSDLVRVRSDENGQVRFTLGQSGNWYVRFIDLRKKDESEYWYTGILTALGLEEPRIFYESLWATLTFHVR